MEAKPMASSIKDSVPTKPAGWRPRPDPHRALASKKSAPDNTALLLTALTLAGPEAMERVLDDAVSAERREFEAKQDAVNAELAAEKLPWYKRLAHRLGFGKK
jgi:hypothetical protein